MKITDILRKTEKRLQKLSASGSSEDSNVRKNVQGHDGLDLEMNEKKASFLDDDISDMGFSELQTTTGRKNKPLTAENNNNNNNPVWIHAGSFYYGSYPPYQEVGGTI